MTDQPTYLEDYANALGHVVLSHNALETAIADLAERLWSIDDPDIDTLRLMGRRSFDERLGLLAVQLNNPLVQKQFSQALINAIDQLLARCRPIVQERHKAVHQSSKTFQVGSEVKWDGRLDDWEAVEALLSLSDRLDGLCEEAIVLCQRLAETRLADAGG
ncbi:MAG: hypothetical protein AAF556_05575 [Pseudomonadota bacterium]